MSLLLILIIALCPAVFPKAKEYKKTSAEIFGIASFGNCEKYPMCSLLSFFTCINSPLAGVSLTVRETSDKQLVAAPEDSLKGIAGADKKISELTYEKLSEYKLLNSDGTKSVYSAARLDGILAGMNGKKIIILDCEENIISDVVKAVKSAKVKDNVYIRCKTADNEILAKKTEGLSFVPYKKSNVIFSLGSELKFAEKSGCEFAQFATKNKYGVMFSGLFTKGFDKTKGLFSFADKELSAGRPDTVEGWENIIRCGYSYIESTNVKGLCQYLEMLEESVSSLKKSIEISEKTDIKNLEGQAVKDFKKAVEAGKEITENKKIACVSDINKINEAIMEKTEEAKTGKMSEKGVFKITLPKILWVVFVIVLFTAASVYIRKKTKKR